MLIRNLQKFFFIEIDWFYPVVFIFIAGNVHNIHILEKIILSICNSCRKLSRNCIAIIESCGIEWKWLLKKKIVHMVLSQIVIRTPIPQFPSKCCFWLGAGRLKTLTATLKWAIFLNYLRFWKVASEPKYVLKAKNAFCFTFVQVKKHFAHFGGLKLNV